MYSLQVNTIAQLRHSVAAGHTVLLSQTDEIHESFYDLFNQRFRSIEVPKEKNKATEYRYYANIAIGAHSKPCRVNPKFQCVVVVNNEELLKTPAPFLNRFEKYLLSHRSLIYSTVQALPKCVQVVLSAVQTKVCFKDIVLLLLLVPCADQNITMNYDLYTRELCVGMVLIPSYGLYI